MTRITTSLAAIALLFSACCSSGRASPPDDPPAPVMSEVEARVLELLSAYEHVPTPEDWQRIGTPEEVSAALVAIADKPDGKTLIAARATSSLAHFPRPEVGAFLERRLSDAKVHASLRGKAAIALAVGFGDAKAKAIAPLFTSPDEALREDAVRALSRLVSPAAERFLENREKVEPSERLRGVMRDARGTIATRRQERTRDNSYPKELDALPAIDDPGPVK